MTLRLSINNMDRRPDGGPMFVERDRRGLEFGRADYLDWTLPDPTAQISRKHCEIHYSDGGYWLHDVSKGGTFVNGSPFRMEAPRELRDGDRLAIGQYIIAVEVRGQQSRAPVKELPESQGDDFDWNMGNGAAPPIDPDKLRPAPKTPSSPVDFPFEVPDIVAPSVRAPAPAGSDDWMGIGASVKPPRDWAAPLDAAPVVAQPAPIPPPRFEGEASPSPSQDDGARLLAQIAVAAGVSPTTFAGRDPTTVATEIGAALRATANNLFLMLRARAETKAFLRASGGTLVQATENNPLKFIGTPEDALAAMLGPPSRSYLDAVSTIERSFADLKAHQLATYGAIEQAVEALFDDLAPRKIEASVEPDKGLIAFGGSRKARLWDVFVERWRAKSRRSDGRLNEAFMLLFTEAYDRLNGRR